MAVTRASGPILALFLSSVVLCQTLNAKENISIITSNGLFEVFEPIALKVVLSRRIAQENETLLAGSFDGEVILSLNSAKNGTAFISRTTLTNNLLSKTQLLDNVSGDPSSFGQVCFHDGGFFMVRSGESDIYELNLTTLRIRKVLDAQSEVKGIACDGSKKVIYYATEDSMFQFNATSKVSNLITRGLIISSGISYDEAEETLIWISKTSKRRGLSNIYQIEFLRLKEATKSELFCILPSLRSINADYLLSSNGQVFVADIHGTIWKADKKDKQECKVDIVRHLNSGLGKPVSLQKVTPLIQYQELENTLKEHSNPCKDYCHNPPNSIKFASNCEVDSKGNPFCKCSDGYQGERCEINLCSNFCMNNGLCNFDNVSQKPTCSCILGFSGERCEESFCDGFCLNNGTCSIDVQAAKPQCLCSPEFYGDRCGIYKRSSKCSNDPPNDYFSLFVLFLIISLILAVVLIVTLFKYYKTPSLHRPILVRKNPGTKTFGFKPARGLDSKAISDRPLLSCTNHSIVLDLEDCCQMTICDEPCPEAIFRKPTSCHTNATCSDLDNVISENTRLARNILKPCSSPSQEF